MCREHRGHFLEAEIFLALRIHTHLPYLSFKYTYQREICIYCMLQ